MLRDPHSAHAGFGISLPRTLLFLVLIVFAGTAFFLREQLLALCDYGLANITFFVRRDNDPFLTAENSALREQTLVLKEQLRQFSSLKEENEKLRRMLQIERKYPLSLVVASVLWKDPTDWKRIAVIGRGKKDNLMKDMLVINESGSLVGKIAEVTDNFSYVMLLVDPSFKIIARVKDKPVEGLYQGALSGGGNFAYSTEGAPIAEKDQLYISENSMYPSGFLIGSIQKIHRDKEAVSVKIEVSTAADVSNLKYVFVVNKAPEYINSGQ